MKSELQKLSAAVAFNLRSSSSRGRAIKRRRGLFLVSPAFSKDDGINMTIQNKTSKSKAEIMRGYAKRLMDEGFKVLPIRPAKRGIAKSGKAPLTRHGVHDATKNYSDFKLLAGSAQDFGIAVATGSASGVIIIDIDPRNGGKQTFAELKGRLGRLPRTVTCLSGGDGRHFYFSLPASAMKMKGKLGQGVDLLGEGRYAVAPPSLHSSGKRYKWAENLGPKEQEIASLPRLWLQFIQDTDQPKPEQTADEADTIPEGSRNAELSRIAGKLRRAGLSETELFAVLLVTNNERCDPPLDKDEVAGIARSVSKYPAGSEPRDEGQKVAQALLEAEFSGGLWLRYEADGHFWSWVNSNWAVIPDKILQQKILTFVNSEFPSNKSAKTLVGEVFGLLQILQARGDDSLHFASVPPNVVNVANFELWLHDDGTVEARRHDPATGMRHASAVKYDPAATCPEYDAALSRIFERAEHPKTLVNFFNELLGYSIQLRRDVALIVLMIGRGSNGKTSLVRVMMELVGASFVHSGRVGELDEARFGIGSLFGKLLFVDDDVRAGAKLPDGALKKISEAKLLTGEHKFKPAFSFVNRAFPVLLCNNLPSLADLSPGMMRRIHVLPFDRAFDEHEIDRGLFDRIIQKELSGVLNRALEGWKRLKRRQRFPRSTDMQRARHDLLAHANPLKGFIDECCEADPKGKVALEKFYVAYRDWATRSGYSMTQVKSTVKKNLLHQGYPVKRHGEGLVVIGLKLRQL